MRAQRHDQGEEMVKEHKSEGEENGVSDEELRQVIADFLDMGHVENIVAMFRQEQRYYDWVGDLLTDERFAVRLGVCVLFEYLVEERPAEVCLAIDSLARQLDNETGWVRGEAVTVLGLIGDERALELVAAKVDDPDPQVAEIARDIIAAREA
jgi:HEAT repeat protein